MLSENKVLNKILVSKKFYISTFLGTRNALRLVQNIFRFAEKLLRWLISANIVKQFWAILANTRYRVWLCLCQMNRISFRLTIASIIKSTVFDIHFLYKLAESYATYVLRSFAKEMFSVLFSILGDSLANEWSSK